MVIIMVIIMVMGHGYILSGRPSPQKKMAPSPPFRPAALNMAVNPT